MGCLFVGFAVLVVWAGISLGTPRKVAAPPPGASTEEHTLYELRKTRALLEQQRALNAMRGCCVPLALLALAALGWAL